MDKVHENSINGLRVKYSKLKDEYQNGDVTPERQEEICKELESLNRELINIQNCQGFKLLNKKYGTSKF